jgi:hypothetical protein
LDAVGADSRPRSMSFVKGSVAPFRS